MGKNVNLSKKSEAMVAAEKAMKESTQKNRPVFFSSEEGDAVQVKIPKNAQLERYNGSPYFVCLLPIKGAHVKLNVFGVTEKDRGKKVSTIVELRCNLEKVKDTYKGIYYLRAQNIQGERANKKLVVRDTIPALYDPMVVPLKFKGVDSRCEIAFIPVSDTIQD